MYYGIPCPGTGEISQNLYTHPPTDTLPQWATLAVAGAPRLSQRIWHLHWANRGALLCGAPGAVSFSLGCDCGLCLRAVCGGCCWERKERQRADAQSAEFPGSSSCTVWVTVFHSVDWIIILKIQIWRYTFRLWFPTTDNNNGYVWYTLKDRSFETYDVMPRTVQRAAAKPNCKILINKKKIKYQLMSMIQYTKLIYWWSRTECFDNLQYTV